MMALFHWPAPHRQWRIRSLSKSLPRLDQVESRILDQHATIDHHFVLIMNGQAIIDALDGQIIHTQGIRFMELFRHSATSASHTCNMHACLDFLFSELRISTICSTVLAKSLEVFHF